MLIVDKLSSFPNSLRRYLPNGEVLITVDRSSILGNPFYLANTNDDAARDNVCDAYEAYFTKMVALGGVTIIQDSPTITKALISQIAKDKGLRLSYFDRVPTPGEFNNVLEDIKLECDEESTIRLLCWCAPKRCHADTIKAYLDGSLIIESLQLPMEFIRPMNDLLISLDLPTL
jgi:hypothetical protein